MAYFWLIAATLLKSGAALAMQTEQKTDHVTVEMHTSADTAAGGRQIEIMLKFKMQPGWHIFSENAGEIAMPTTVDWSLPIGARVVGVQWSQDSEFNYEEIIQHGYADTAYYRTQIALPPELGQTLPLEATVRWLACGEECFPEQQTLRLTLPTAAQAAPAPDWDMLLKEAGFSSAAAGSGEDVPARLQWILLAAFVGGIIMNAMPCVFPILALKVVSLSQTAGKNNQKLAKALSYTAGVTASFLLIAFLLTVLRKGGSLIGWGFQMQSPWFVGAMAVLFLLLSLAMLDFISLPAVGGATAAKISRRQSVVNAFATGFLAVLVATPCTAPFMGAAVGYALNAAPSVGIWVFVSLGLGYALPFAAAELYPQKIGRWLPRPGKWMRIFKQILAIPLILTFGWLSWIWYHQVAPQPVQNQLWQPYNAAQIEQLVQSGKPVFVDFTAKWCLTCILNKRSTLGTSEFETLAKERGIHLFRADWTNNDAEISMALESFGRSSVPLYVYYDGKNQDYRILPPLLTLNIVKNYLTKP